jgi:hypothetical protein
MPTASRSRLLRDPFVANSHGNRKDLLVDGGAQIWALFFAGLALFSPDNAGRERNTSSCALAEASDQYRTDKSTHHS